MKKKSRCFLSEEYTLYFLFFHTSICKEVLSAFVEYFPNFQPAGIAGIVVDFRTPKYLYFSVKYNPPGLLYDSPPYQILAYSRRSKRVMPPHTRLDKIFQKRNKTFDRQIDPKDYPQGKQVPG